MTYIKGHSGNPNGRPKGAKGKAKSSLVAKIHQLIDENFNTIQDDLSRLDPEGRVRAITNLLNYVIPKQQSANFKSAIEEEYIHLEKLMKEAPDEFIDRITEKIIKIKEDEEV